MARVALLLGGNQGDVKRTLQTAQQLVNSRVGAVLRCSHRYESEPWGFPGLRSVFRTRRWRSPPTSRRTRCSTPASGSSGNWPQPRRRGGREGLFRSRLLLAADRHRHHFLRRRSDRRRTPHGSPSAARRAGIRAGAALRDHAPAAASRDGSYRRRDARRAPKQIERV